MTNANFSIGHRVNLSFGLLLLLLLAVLVIYLHGNYQQAQATSRLADIVMPKADAANQLQIAYLYQSAGARSYILTGEEQWLSDYQRGLDLASGAVSRLDQLPKIAQSSELFEEMRSLAVRFTELADRAIALRQQGGAEEARQILESEMYPTRSELLSRAEAFIYLQYRFTDEAKAELGQVQAGSTRNFIAIALLGLLIAVVLAHRTAVSVREPVRTLLSASDHLAGGSYTSAIGLAGAVASKGTEIPSEVKHLAARLQVAAQDLLVREGRLQAQNAKLEAQAREMAQLSRALAESEERFRTVFQQAAVGIARVGVDGRFLEVNERFCEITGYQQEELTRLTYLDVIRSDGSEARSVESERLLKGEIQSYLIQKRAIRKDGSVAWVEVTVSAVREPSGEPKYIVAIVEDVTGRKAMEEERERLLAQVEEERSLLQAVLQQMPSGVFISRAPTGELIAGNEQATAIWRHPFIPSADVSEYGAYKGFHQDGSPYLPEDWPIARAMSGAEVREEEIRILRGDGTYGVTSQSAAPIRDGDGRIVSATVVLTDITDRKRAEEELRKSEEFANKVLTSSLNGLYVYDLEHEAITFTNPQYAALTGYTQYTLNSMSGMEFLSLFHPDDRLRVEQHIESMKSAGDDDIREIEYRFKREDGQWMWCLSRESVFARDAGGAVRQYIGTFVDITERRRVEEERERLLEDLREANRLAQYEHARWQKTVEGIPDLVVVCDADGRATYFNPVHSRLFGHHVEPSVPMEDQPAHFQLYRHDGSLFAARDLPLQRAALFGEEVQDVEIILRTPEGDERRTMWDAAPLRDLEGRVTGAVAIGRDVTRQKAAEAERERLIEELSEAHENLSDAHRQVTIAALENERLAEEAGRRAAEWEATVAAIADGLILYDPHGTIRYMNEGAQRILIGYSEEERRQIFLERNRATRMEKADGSLFRPEELPALRALRGEKVHNEVVVLHTGNRVIWTSTSVAPVQRSDGGVLGAVATFADVTKLHDLQEQQRQWVAMASHDLRSPLSVVQGQAQMLQRYAERPESVRKSADAIFSSARRMNTMIQDMLDSARLESGELHLDLIPTDLASYLHDLADRLAAATGSERLRLEISEDPLPPVLADPSRIERVFTNLITNAMKYSDGEVWLRAEQQGSNVVVSVADQGRGIPKAEQKNIFERFYRASNREGRDGLGLGLYICRMLVEAHGGKIRVESEEGKGSTFIVELPSTNP